MVNALSRKEKLSEFIELRSLGAELEVDPVKGVLARHVVRHLLLDRIREAYGTNECVVQARQKMV